MKNIEWLSKDMKISVKLEWITYNVNQILLSDFDENSDIFLDIRYYFKLLTRFWRTKLSKIETEKDFEEFMLWFEKILKELDLEKLYNTTNLSQEKLKYFDKLSLLMQFFYISTPLKTNKNFKFMKWWTCYNWTLFFNNLFNYFDEKWVLDKKMLSFWKYYNHSVFIVWFKDKKYIVDPYSKEKWLLTEIKKLNKIYIAARWWELLYWTIVSEEPLELEIQGKRLIPNAYSKNDDLIENMYITHDILNIKTYLNWKTLHLIVDEVDDNIIINFNWEQFMREKEFAIMDIVWLYMEWKNPTKFDILMSFLWFNKETMDKSLLNEFELISDKINLDFFFEKLWI